MNLMSRGWKIECIIWSIFLRKFKQPTLCWTRLQQFCYSGKVFAKVEKKHANPRRSCKKLDISDFMLVSECCPLYPLQILPRGEAISNQVPFRDFAIKSKAMVELCWRSTFQEAAKVCHYWNHVVLSFVEKHYFKTRFNSS